ncbi:MAG: ATPase [Comamonadaceae bacterium]|nr:MAG: ATPase [Comamonadaceae bacterium]
MKIAVLGAESTGKTELTRALAAHFRAQGRSVTLVAEVLREWCENTGRVPVASEQLAIAQEQARRADASDSDVLIADTGPLMIAVYSDMLFNDSAIYGMALAHQRTYDATLVTGIDLPWVADGLRDGPHAQEPTDRLLRAALARGNIDYKVVYGTGPERLRNALMAIDATIHPRLQASSSQNWSCDKCSDPECEHHLFTGLLQSRAAGRPGP